MISAYAQVAQSHFGTNRVNRDRLRYSLMIRAEISANAGPTSVVCLFGSRLPAVGRSISAANASAGESAPESLQQ